jgi:hypothetical protein
MVTYIFLALVAYACGLLADLIDFCMGSPSNGAVAPGRIFSSIGKFLGRKYDEKEVEHGKWNVKMRSEGYNERSFLNWWKLGICPYCYNVWLCTIAVLLTVWLHEFSWEYLWWLPTFWGFAHLGLSKARQARQ